MDFAFIIALAIDFIFIIGYGQAQRFEGSSCTLSDGSRGTCKNVAHCESIIEGLQSGSLRYDNIVGCSFVGTVQIACCADERPFPGRTRPTRPTPPNTDFVFTGPRKTTTTPTPIKPTLLPWMEDVLSDSRTPSPTIVYTTTSKSIAVNTPRTTTLNSFWNEWSVTNPTMVDDFSNGSNQGRDIYRQTTTTDMPDWLKDVLSDHSTNSNVMNNGNNRPIKTTTVQTPDNMPSWMREVLNEHSTATTTKKSIIGGGGGSSSGSNSYDDLYVSQNRPTSPSNRVTQRPTSSSGSNTNSRYSPGTKAESACERYSALPVAISWNILGGIPTYRGEFPWMAALGYRSKSDINFDCGGSLISDNFVLTAAHCAPPRRQPQLVRLGKVTLFTNDDDGQPFDVDIQEIIRHPDYKSSTKKNDIALVRLAQRIQFTENIRPACLRTDLTDIRPEIEMLVTGWGTTSSERTVRPSILLKTNVTSMPLQLCNTTLLNYNRDANQPSLREGLSQSQCCAFDPMARNDACQGDSGGPLQIFPHSSNIASVVGVVSFGISCGTTLPGVYTRVAYYLQWIESIVWPNQ
ncbi:serine protease persephone-like [Contarinia nasturtii]|uniref:serine protease persephone-like n=1 Tax=Contarinia nasturtii TaxID=265458 RepID=UPI0012D3CE29|nr:serine protease persephone-like [Contarinia nasturtii]